MKVKFVRHGQTDLNSPIRRMQGISNYDLNETGIKQAQITRDKLANEEFDLIISSPLLRAKHTAEIINESKKYPLMLDDRIIERNYGSLEGKEYKEEYCYLDYDYESIGGESIKEMKIRLKAFINDIKEKYHDKKVLVVAHNGIIRLISWILDGEPEVNNIANYGIKNGEIKELDFN